MELIEELTEIKKLMVQVHGRLVKAKDFVFADRLRTEGIERLRGRIKDLEGNGKVLEVPKTQEPVKSRKRATRTRKAVTKPAN